MFVPSQPASALFSPIRFGDLELSNRIVMAPLTRARAGKTRVLTTAMVTPTF